MKRFLSLTLCLAMVAAASVAFAATSGTTDRDSVERQIAVAGPGVVQISNSSSLAARETTGPDTFAIYGGPDEITEGKFQLANGVTPDWGDGLGAPRNPGDPFGAAAWKPVDRTDLPVFWHRDTFNADGLAGNGAGNHALWSGVALGDPYGESWADPPGYGNSWNDAAIYESAPLADPSVGQLVSLDFYYRSDTEPGFDFFNVEYDSAGEWISVYSVDGKNGFTNPGLQYSAQSPGDIVYTGNDYGGVNGDQIRIRLLVTSDGAWSDEDGLWPTDGAAYVDDISLTTTQGTFTEDFETEQLPPNKYLFNPDKAPFAGDFAEVYPVLTDIDPCIDNNTPVIGMLDYGQEIRNGPGLGGETSIVGGSTSTGINYGIIGNHTVNYTGGLSFGEVSVYNEIWSPDITWDLPGTGDDAIEISGSFIRWTVWRHLPLANGYFYVWAVRSALAGEPYGSWADRNFVYYGGGVASWFQSREDVSDILQAGPEKVQMSLGAIDYASVFGFAGTAATPSPVFDNAAFYKYRLAGPTFATRTIDTANDGFPVSGSIDVSTQAARDALDIPFNMARDVNTGDQFNVPGDSVIVDVASVIPGATVTDIRMVWALNTNAVFEDAVRAAPNRVKDENVVAGAAGTIWTGEVVADTAKTSANAIIDDRFFVDLPDVDFIYPGDILHYYIEATDSDGRTTTLPANTDGFLDFSPLTSYNRAWTVRGLPTIKDTAGTQPNILVWNDFGRRGGENEWTTAFQQLGYGEGVDFDTYTTQGPTSGVGNGLGSAGAHGANADQLAGYNHMFYFSGNLSTVLLSNGDPALDKGNDIDVMEQWHALAGGSRNCAYFGDYIASGLINDSPEGLAYTVAPMGIAYGDENVRDGIGGQTAPLVVPNAGSSYAGNFSTEYIAYGGCLSINEFDQFQPLVTAEAGHLFTDANGTPIAPVPGDASTTGVASVINDHGNGLDISFPYASFYVYNVQDRAVNLSTRTLLFQEILGLFNTGPGTVGQTSAPKFLKPQLAVRPNPFNPSTEVSFSNTFGKQGSVKVFNLRGELVKTLHNGAFTNPEGFSTVWDGTDNRGATVASGVYVIQAQADGQVDTKKAALVK